MTKSRLLLSALAGILQAGADEPAERKLTVYFHDDNPIPQVGTIAETTIRSGLSGSSLYLYDKMDRKGKALVYQLMQQECKSQNGCKGLNSCAPLGSNQCAGRAECKGTANGKFDDVNLAVKVAAKRMCEEKLEISLK